MAGSTLTETKLFNAKMNRVNLQKVIDAREGKSWPMGSIERFAFYEKARDAYAVIVTGETRFYGCFVLKKGVIPPKA